MGQNMVAKMVSGGKKGRPALKSPGCVPRVHNLCFGGQNLGLPCWGWSPARGLAQDEPTTSTGKADNTEETTA